jgi:hypothetical protein
MRSFHQLLIMASALSTACANYIGRVRNSGACTISLASTKSSSALRAERVSNIGTLQ